MKLKVGKVFCVFWKRVIKAGNIAFGLTFAICAVVICAGVFAVALVICYIRLGATMSQAVHSTLIFFVEISIVFLGVLRILACINHKRREKSMPHNEVVLVKEQQPVNVFIADGNMQAKMIISTLKELKDNGIMAYGQDLGDIGFASVRYGMGRGLDDRIARLFVWYRYKFLTL